MRLLKDLQEMRDVGNDVVVMGGYDVQMSTHR